MAAPIEFQGFVGPSYRTRFLQASAEECINLMPIRLESPNASPRFMLAGTPGIASTISGMNGRIRGQFSQDGRSFAVDSSTGGNPAQLYETTSGAAVALGNVADDFSGDPVTMESNGSASGSGGHQLIVCASKHGYVYDLATGVFAEITSAGFPTGSALAVTYFDGYFLVLTSTYVGQSALEDGTSWTATARGSRNFTSDNNVAFVNNYTLHFLLLLGSKRGEIWVDNGGSTFAFGPIQSPQLNIGCAAAGTLKRFNGTVAWLGQDEHGTRIVYLLNGYAAIRISTDAVEYDLATFATVSDFVAWVYQEEGHEFYVLTSVANNRTWVYDAHEQLWHKRAYTNPTTGLDQCIRGFSHCVSPSGAQYVGDYTNGVIYTQSLSTYTDNTIPLIARRRFPHTLAQNRRVFYPGLEIQAMQGLGLANGQGSDPQLMMSFSDDGGETFGIERTGSLGKMGAYGNRTFWQNLGSGRNRVFQVSISDPVPRGLLAAYFSPAPTIGTN